MKKSILPAITAAALLGTLIMPQYGFALSESERINQELSKLKKDKASAQQKASDAQNQIGKVQQEKQQTSKDINLIMNQVDEVTKKLTDLNNKVAAKTDELQENAQNLQDAEERVATRDQMLRSRLRLMYMNGFVSYADVLLSSTSFSDFLDRLNALNSIVNQDKEVLEANQRDRDLIAEKKQVVETQLAEVKQLYSDAEDTKAELVAKEKEKEVKIASLTKKEKELEDITEEQQNLVISFAKKESQLLAEQIKAQKKPSNFTYNGGKFAYPLVKQATMTSDFGVRKDPFTGKQAGHTGIDLAVPKGTDILAAENGVVILAGWWSGYGNCVIIDHGKGVWTLYGHIRDGGIGVEKGESVKRGQKIAEVGATGRATGNHLHFEVRINEEPVDPKPYLR
ncbi:murein hydrolase activator EnvC family protein [Paenibacillus thalictri]|uniref:Peptidase M23 n=1 Tax=Paenibacillus thalictri TaxID=2527873 RepID=A0A4Q9DIH6_9BACL|nr:peptidoglycan DD-metalloendopeptidase family protein [Paenibacillus thalictri]TBL73034.1 peptidase M23 [Paenibacillus thalictri]